MLLLKSGLHLPSHYNPRRFEARILNCGSAPSEETNMKNVRATESMEPPSPMPSSALAPRKQGYFITPARPDDHSSIYCGLALACHLTYLGDAPLPLAPLFTGIAGNASALLRSITKPLPWTFPLCLNMRFADIERNVTML